MYKGPCNRELREFGSFSLCETISCKVSCQKVSESCRVLTGEILFENGADD